MRSTPKNNETTRKILDLGGDLFARDKEGFYAYQRTYLTLNDLKPEEICGIIEKETACRIPSDVILKNMFNLIGNLVDNKEKVKKLTESQITLLIQACNDQQLLQLFKNTDPKQCKLFDAARTNTNTIDNQLETSVHDLYVIELIKNGINSNPYNLLLENLNKKTSNSSYDERMRLLLPIARYVNNLRLKTLQCTDTQLTELIQNPHQLNKLFEEDVINLGLMTQRAVRVRKGLSDTSAAKLYYGAVNTYIQEELVQNTKMDTKEYTIRCGAKVTTVVLPNIKKHEPILNDYLNGIGLMEPAIAQNTINILTTLQQETINYNAKVEARNLFLASLNVHPDTITAQKQIMKDCSSKNLTQVFAQLLDYTEQSSTLALGNKVEYAADPVAVLKSKYLLKTIWQDLLTHEQREQCAQDANFCFFMKIITNMGVEFQERDKYYDNYATDDNKLRIPPVFFCTAQATSALRHFITQNKNWITNTQNIQINYNIAIKENAHEEIKNKLKEFERGISQSRATIISLNDALLQAEKAHAEGNQIIKNDQDKYQVVQTEKLNENHMQNNKLSTQQLQSENIEELPNKEIVMQNANFSKNEIPADKAIENLDQDVRNLNAAIEALKTEGEILVENNPVAKNKKLYNIGSEMIGSAVELMKIANLIFASTKYLDGKLPTILCQRFADRYIADTKKMQQYKEVWPLWVNIGLMASIIGILVLATKKIVGMINEQSLKGGTFFLHRISEAPAKTQFNEIKTKLEIICSKKQPESDVQDVKMDKKN